MKSPVTACALAVCLSAGWYGALGAQSRDEMTGNSMETSSAGAEEAVPTANVADLDVSQLMDVRVSSVSKTEQKMSRVAAAVFVITREDIRRSGATNIPDLLRMVPGLDVAQINANSWAISARGFNHQFSDKLLVLIDGRAVYTPLFGGVYWDVQDVVLEDIARIEVIRGPGAAVWGANAVNGVINVITKKASDTQGGLITAGGGSQELGFGTAQYGGKIGEDFSYRVFAKGFDHNHFPDLTAKDAADSWDLLHGGFRVDGNLSPKDSATFQGDIYGGGEGSQFSHIVSIAPPVNLNVNGSAELAGGNILSRWNHEFSAGSDTTLQVYYDRSERFGPQSNEDLNTFDLDFQHHLAVGARHDLLWGGDYRHTSDHTAGTIDQAWLPASRSLQLYSVFIQDEIVLRPDCLFLTVGSKLENNYLSGLDVSPSIRAAWTPRNRHTFWAAVSRAARTPSRRNTDADVNITVFPGPAGIPAELTLLGNPDERPEHLLAYELGYRAQPAGPLSVDIAVFFNSYSHLATTEPGSPFPVNTPAPAHLVFPLVWDNKMRGNTQGIEVSANWKVTPRWTVSTGYSLLQMHLRTDSGSRDIITAPNTEGSSPHHQAQLRTHVNLPGHFLWDVSGYFVGPLSTQQVPSFVRLDTQLSRVLGERVELSLVGQNLLRDHHLESNDSLTSLNPSQVKRSAYMKVVWRF